MVVRVRAVVPSDEAPWAVLYRGYRSFYNLAPDEEAVRTTWAWVSSRDHGCFGLVAVDHGDEVVGLANLRRFARPSTATVGLYLDDLFTSPTFRGAGVATALLKEASAIAAREGASVVRWITAADNDAARRLYDRLAVATQWVTYDMKPATR